MREMNKTLIQALEKYSSGWRGAPAKGVDGLRRARVQIPLSPLFSLEKENKKVVDKQHKLCYYNWVAKNTFWSLKKRNWKKILTSEKSYDKLK